MAKKNQTKSKFRILAKNGLTILISVLIIFAVVKAGTITVPSGTPSAKFYTLSEIYNFITTNATATEGTHSFTFADSLEGSGKTLTQIYDALASLITANKVKSGTTYLGTEGTLVPSGGDAVVGNVLSGKTFFGDSQTNWTLKTGTMANNGAFSLSCGVDDQSVTAGYYSGGTLSGDEDLISGNILTGKTIFGIPGSLTAGYTYGDNDAAYVLGSATGAPGTALKNLWNGTGTWGVGGSQANGGVDDSNYGGGGTPTSVRYTASWTACTSGDTPIAYCGTNDSGADAKDNSTGLIWSKPCKGSGCSSFTESSPSEYSWSSSAVNNNSRTAYQLCSDHAGWSLPHQKQLLQAYIDGSYGNLVPVGSYSSFWSATTESSSATYAFFINLSNGLTNYDAKNTVTFIRCVR